MPHRPRIRSTKLADFHIPTVAIIGGESLIGREVRDLLGGLKPSPDIRLVSGEADSTKVTRDESGEAILLAPLDTETLALADVMILAGTPESARRALELNDIEEVALIDLTGTLEEHPRARLRAPELEPVGTRPDDAIDVIAHPAAIALAMFYQRLAEEFPILSSVVEVFEPASELGQAGITELQAQSVNLLSFKPLPKDVYDAQVGFSLLAAYGKESRHNLEEVEARIDRHLATLLLISSHAPMPSLRLIQAPVFHGYSASIWVEFKQKPQVQALEEALASMRIEVRTSDEEPPNNVGVVGENGLSVGGIRADRNHPRAFWFWLVADNLRIMAEAAVAVAKENL